jgi:CRP-like cAMP-binding protein
MSQHISEALAEGARLLQAAFSRDRRVAPPRFLLSGPVSSTRCAFMLESGWAKRSRPLPNGRRSLLAIYLPGDVIGLDAVLRCETMDEIETLSTSSYQVLEHQQLIELAAERSVGLQMLNLLIEEREREDRHTAMLSGMSGEVRLAQLLLDLLGRRRPSGAQQAKSFPCPLTQRDMADHLGMTGIHVNRLLRDFRERDIAAMRSHIIEIFDCERLAQIAMH